MTTGKTRLLLRATWFSVGLILVAAAITVALRQVDWSLISKAGIWQLAALASAAAGNLLLSGLLFWTITRSFNAQPPVSFGKMLKLMCAAALVNYLPLRPGLVGRAAYLKLHHRLPLRKSVAIGGNRWQSSGSYLLVRWASRLLPGQSCC